MAEMPKAAREAPHTARVKPGPASAGRAPLTTAHVESINEVAHVGALQRNHAPPAPQPQGTPNARAAYAMAVALASRAKPLRNQIDSQ